jgi:hypothetical protein
MQTLLVQFGRLVLPTETLAIRRMGRHARLLEICFSIVHRKPLQPNCLRT